MNLTELEQRVVDRLVSEMDATLERYRQDCTTDRDIKLRSNPFYVNHWLMIDEIERETAVLTDTVCGPFRIG